MATPNTVIRTESNGHIVSGIAIEVKYGMGRHVENVSMEETMEQLKFLLVAVLHYNMGMNVVKVSFLLQYRRVFVAKNVQRICFWAMIFVVLWACAQATLLGTSCLPISIIVPSTASFCLNTLPIWYFSSGMSMATDIMIFCIPLPSVLKLRLPTRQKAMLFGVFSLGFFVCIISIYRMFTLRTAVYSEDPPWENIGAAIWSAIELNTSIIAASLPTLRPLLAKWLPGAGLSSAHKSTSAYPRYGSSSGMGRSNFKELKSSGQREVSTEELVLKDMIASQSGVMPSVYSQATAEPKVASPTAPAASFNWQKTSHVLAFGDSYTYVQGTEGWWGYSFIGSQLNISFTPEQLLSDRIVPGQNTSSAGGPNWIEELTGCKDGLPRDCEIQLWNFAFAGADISTTFVPLHHDYTISFENQVWQWDTYGRSVINADQKLSLVASFIGINDINDMANFEFPLQNLTSFEELYTAAIAEQFTALETVHKAGYRNFLFLNLPPLDKTPASQTNPNRKPDTAMINTFNDVLNQTAKAFTEQHPGTTAMVFDTYSWLTHVFNNAASFGITNTTSFCPKYNAWDIATNYESSGCQPIGEYFWYNSGHIAYTVSQLLGSKVDEFLTQKSGSCGNKTGLDESWGTLWDNGKAS
ncbi:lysophospholipase a [Colletotrichum karsti]|uniref:Lysophospholipase a n=1 Tax=Colletotrichum karsti TaxID=1095194 RepID=A0A9P6HVX9_9PEZI|nr:lysophospholipase a [Colletotrichum karsti]KAF9870967.1 lysophospholipase a [Colletotrichum karsti]